MEMTADEEEPKFKKITFNTDYKIKTSLKEPPSNLELKPLPDNLKYVFLEEPCFLPVIISSQLSEQNIKGIVLGHKVSGAGLDVDKAKINVISKLPPLLMSKALEVSKTCRKKSTENVLVDQLSRIDNDETSDDSDVNDKFPGDTLMEITTNDTPLFTDLANYLLGPETRTILDECHHGPTDGYYGPNITAKKVLDLGFYWSTIVKEAHTLVCLCEASQKTRNISKRDEMPLNSIQVCEIFDIL
ncbi:hypothetical protein Tco_0305426 [Tanacetum coccineum]